MGIPMDEFVDATDLLRPGIYILFRAGKIIYVGKADKAMLPKIAAHRDLARKSVPAWLPIKGIQFDRVLIKYTHPDRIEAEVASLILEHNPHYNMPSPAILTAPVIRINRRV